MRSGAVARLGSLKRPTIHSIAVRTSSHARARSFFLADQKQLVGRQCGAEAGLFEPGDLGEIAQARQSDQCQERWRCHIGAGRAGLRTAWTCRNQSQASQRRDDVAADWPTEHIGNAHARDRLEISYDRQHQLFEPGKIGCRCGGYGA